MSKLSTDSDGWRITRTILTLYRIERPLLFFGWLSGALALLALLLVMPVLVDYAITGFVPRSPT